MNKCDLPPTSGLMSAVDSTITAHTIKEMIVELAVYISGQFRPTSIQHYPFMDIQRMSK